jgi:hypothetical protein
VAIVALWTAPPASAGSGPCADLEPVALGGTVTEPRLLELSGLAASRRHPDVLWAHNDSGGAAELYALAEDGTALGAYSVEGSEAIDWEDMAAGPGADGEGDFLYVGDIGDNDAARPSVIVYRVPEPAAAPAAPGASLPGGEPIELRYPGGPSDAEALLVDPLTGDVVIVTKSLLGASRVLEADAASLVTGAPVTMSDTGGLRVPLPPAPGGGLPGTMVTGGDVSPDGSIVVLRTYRSVLVFERAGGQTVAEALLGEPCFGPQEEEPQGEAIAFTGDGAAYVTASEGTNVPVTRVGLAEPAATSTTASSTTTPTEALDDQTEDDTTIAGALIGAAVLLLLLGGGALLVSRRRGASGAG